MKTRFTAGQLVRVKTQQAVGLVPGDILVVSRDFSDWCSRPAFLGRKRGEDYQHDLYDCWAEPLTDEEVRIEQAKEHRE